MSPTIFRERGYRFFFLREEPRNRITAMKSCTFGKNTSVEVTNISVHGVWLLAGEQELFMPYEDFPWFKDVPMDKVLNVKEPKPGHFYWPDLDVDLTAEIIAHPERFPLKSKDEP